LTLQLKPGGTNISIINLEHHALDLEYNLRGHGTQPGTKRGGEQAASQVLEPG